MHSPGRAARLGRTIAISGVLVIVLASAGIYVLLKYAPARPGISHLAIAANAPGANVVVRRKFQRRFMAEAVLDLPPVPPQKDSPSLQVSFFQPGALVQGGVIRTPANRFRLEAFLAYAHAGENETQIRYFGNLPDGPHDVMLTGDERDVVFTLDGKVLDRVPRATYLPDDGPNNPWLMIGTAVATPGSAAFGTISRIFVRDQNDVVARPVVPGCVVTNAGITLVRFGEVWHMGGAYDPDISAKYQHCTAKELPG